jgi:hypothetical protein
MMADLLKKKKEKQHSSDYQKLQSVKSMRPKVNKNGSIGRDC